MIWMQDGGRTKERKYGTRYMEFGLETETQLMLTRWSSYRAEQSSDQSNPGERIGCSTWCK